MHPAFISQYTNKRTNKLNVAIITYIAISLTQVTVQPTTGES